MDSIILPSAGSLCVAAIAFCLAVVHGVLFIRKPEYVWNGWCCLLSSAICLYSIAVTFQYNLGEVPLNHLVDKTQLTSILVIMYALTGFTLSFLRLDNHVFRSVTGAISAVFLSLIWLTDLIIADSFIRRSFMLMRTDYIESTYGPLGPVFFIYVGLTAALSIYFWARHYRQRPRVVTRFFIGAGFWLILGFHDIFVSLGMPGVLFIMEYGFLGFSIFILSLIVSDYLDLFRLVRERESALAKEMEHLSIVLRSITEGVIVVDAGESVTLINPVAEKLTGWNESDVRTRSLNEIFILHDSKTRERVKEIIKRGDVSNPSAEFKGEFILVARDGTERIVAGSRATMHGYDGEVIGHVIVFSDVTDRMEMEEIMVKTRNMQSLSVLAGGIAHDFNNILTSIVGNISLACMSLSPDDEIFKLLTDAKNASYGAKDLTSQLLNFSKGGAPVKKMSDLRNLIRDTVEFTLSGSKVKSRFEIADDLWQAGIDQGQICQVLNNIVLNADQAMPDGGEIKVLAENDCLNASRILTDLDQPQRMLPGRYVKITIRDTGPGIPGEYMKKIFDPYFTTKNRGMGLGLASAYSIVKKHDGFIEVASSPGDGATFILYLPAMLT